MPIFKKKKKKPYASTDNEKNPPEDITSKENIVNFDKEIDQFEVNSIPEYLNEIEINENNQKDKDKVTYKKEENKQWSPSKSKKIISRDMKGKPVFLEDTGEKLGSVFDTTYDANKKIIGYKIKDKKSNSILSFPSDQFEEDKEGLIFVQNWYLNSIKTLEKLEFKERISPELTTLIGDDLISEGDLYNIFVKHDDQMVNFIDEAISLKGLLNQRLKVLEKKRLALKDTLMDLTEKRLIKDIDRREFSENVTEHRHRVNVLDINIKKCKDLLKRLDDSSFGKLGKNIFQKTKINNKNKTLENFDYNKDDDKFVFAEEIENPYKQRYYDIKERYETLQENYNELKLAVEKLISKDEL